MPSTTAKLRWGILGVAKINERLLPAFAKAKHAELRAIASRSLKRAETAAAAAGIPMPYASNAALSNDPAIDAIYNALPNTIRLQAKLGGGSLREVGYYPVYGIRWALAAEPVRVYDTATYKHGVDVEMNGTLWFADGEVATFDCGFTLPLRGWLEIAGTEGVVSIPEMWLPSKRASFIVQPIEEAAGEFAVGGEDQVVPL